MRTTLISILIAIPAMNIMILIWAMMTLRRFKARVREIAHRSQLEQFKRLASSHMRVARFIKPILYLPALVFGAGIFFGPLEVIDILYTIIPAAVVIGVAKICGVFQNAAETLPVKDESLREERDHVVSVWHSGPTPDWE